VNGLLQPLREIKERLGEVPLLVDAAQSAGEVEIDVERDGVDLLAIAGHKHLLGPTGIGALYMRGGLEIEPMMPGGTGSRSASVDQPAAMPDRLEGGTPNIVGIAGLGAALRFLEENGPSPRGPMAIGALSELARLDGVSVLSAADRERQGGLFSFRVDGVAPSAVAAELFTRHRIAVRAGLHCAPVAHRFLRTFDGGGTVRVAFGRFHTQAAADRLVEAIAEIVAAR
jgi:selenocysteine lyase/cysteine desulfurase